MEKLNISYKKEKGTIEWNKNDPSRFKVKINSSIKNDIISFLSKEQIFKVAITTRMDDFEERKIVPASDNFYFERALSRIYAEIGVYVHW